MIRVKFSYGDILKTNSMNCLLLKQLVPGCQLLGPELAEQ